MIYSMKQQIEKVEVILWKIMPFVALVFWGALCITNNLWYDEAFSAALVDLPFTKMLYITAVDAHSPFYYTLLKIAYLLSGSSTHFFALKLFSLVFMVGYMFLGKYYVRKLFDLKTSLYFSLISLLLPIMSVQAGNVRMYALALFCTTLMGLTAYDLQKEPTKKKWLVFAGASICTVYCHTFSMLYAFWFFGIFVVVLWKKGALKKAKSFWLSALAVVICFSPWLLVTAKQMSLRMKYDTGAATERATLLSFADYGKEWFSALETPIMPVVYMGLLIAVILTILGIKGCLKNKNYFPLWGAGAMVLTVLTGFLVSAFINNCFLGRYVFPAFGLFILLCAVGVKEIGKVSWKMVILAVALVCFEMQYASEISLEYDKGLSQYEAFVEEMGEGDVMIGPTIHTVFLSIYHPQVRYYIDGYKSYKMPFRHVDELAERGMLQNESGRIWYICFQGGKPDGFGDGYEVKEWKNFHYMYYDFVIYELVRNGEGYEAVEG